MSGMTKSRFDTKSYKNTMKQRDSLAFSWNLQVVPQKDATPAHHTQPKSLERLEMQHARSKRENLAQKAGQFGVNAFQGCELYFVNEGLKDLDKITLRL